MSDEDLKSFDWHLDDSDVDSDDDDGTRYEFEVKKSQEEQEDFKIHPGFKVSVSELIFVPHIRCQRINQIIGLFKGELV